MNSPVYAVTYFEVAPASAGQAASLARQHADGTRKEDGNMGFEVFAEIGRPNRLAVLERGGTKLLTRRTALSHLPPPSATSSSLC